LHLRDKKIPLARYEIQIVLFEQFVQGGAKKVLKKRAFLLYFPQKTLTFGQFLLICAQFFSLFSANLHV